MRLKECGNVTEGVGFLQRVCECYRGFLSDTEGECYSGCMSVIGVCLLQRIHFVLHACRIFLCYYC